MASRQELEDLLHCMICFEPYRNPKMLHCGHTFCAECLEGYLKTYQQQRRAAQGKLPCPSCRELTALPNGSVMALKTDFKVRKIEEMFRTVNLQQRRASSKMCDACRVAKKQVSSKYFCTNCSMSYCQSCRNKHDKNPIFKDHRVLDRTSEDGSDVFCKVHKGEQVKFLCKTCEAVVCTLCIMSQHEQHEVTELTSVYKRHKDEVNNLQEAVERKLQKLQQKGTEIERLRHLNLKSCTKAEAAIKERSRELIEAVKKEEETQLETLRLKRDDKLQRLMQELDSVNFLVAKAHSLQDFATQTSRKNSIKLVAIHAELILRMKTVAEIDTTIPDQNIQTIITFLRGRNDINFGRIDEISGSSDELKNHRAVLTAAPRKASSSSTSSVNNHHRPKMLICLNKYGSNAGELKDPLGIACLLNGDIVVTEWGNKRVQVFDSVGKPISIMAMGKIGPQGVAVTLKGNIVVTDAQNKRMEVFTPTGTSLSKWGLGKFYGPCGIAVCPNGNFIITDIAEHSISIYQGEKRCIKRFGSKGHKGNLDFNNPLYASSTASSSIVISDSDNHCLKVFDSMGNFVRRIGSIGKRDGQLQFPRGVCVDEDGHILVADRNNDRVSMFTIEGRFLRHVITREDGLRDPYAIAISAARNLVVSESGTDRAAVKMFQL